MKKVLESNEAVSSVVGVIMILGITILSITLLTLYSIPAYNEMEEMANTQKIEQGFTVFDSRTSKAALGESPIQSTRISLMGGTINVNGDSDAYNESNIRIQIIENASIVDEFICPLGTIEYRKDGRIIVYEGGGVWSKYPTGKPVMISPPEFHYNGQTLTLPAMKIKGNSSFGGNSDAAISIVSNKMPSNIYPDKATKSTRVNPLYSDTVRVLIKSEFYEAWAEYANSTIYTYAIVDDANKTAILDLKVIPPSGPSGTNPLRPSFKVGQLNQSDPAPIKGFSMLLEDQGASGLSPFNFDIEAISGNRSLTLNVKEANKELGLSISYVDTGVPGNTEEYWEVPAGSAYPVIDRKYCNLEFTNDAKMITYLPSKAKIGSGAETDFSWDEYVIAEGNTSFSVNDVVQHYMKLMTEERTISFHLEEVQPQGKVDYATSTLTLEYEQPGDISYLHVTSNELDAAVV